jgi:signal transduction histidine kinase/CheY-like chemotaxis protein
MLPTLRPRNLNQALVRLLAAVLLPLLLGTFGVLALQTRQEHRLAQTRLAALAQTLVLASDAEVERGHAQLAVLASSPSLDLNDWPSLYRFAKEVVRTVPGGAILLVDPAGNPVFNTASPFGTALPNLWTLADRNQTVQWEGRTLPMTSGDLSRRALTTGQPVYSDLYYGVQTGRPSLAVAIPVVRGGRPAYALVLSYPPEQLQRMLQTSVTVPEVRAILLDRNDLVVATNSIASSRLGDKAIEAATEPGRSSGFYRATARDGLRVMGAYVVSAKNGFTVRVSQPETSPFLPTRMAALAWLVLLLVAIVSSAMLASLFSRRLARPLRELGEDVQAGRAPPPERQSGIAEIDVLAGALREGARAEDARMEERTLRKLAQQQEAMLRQADRQKDEFLATLAHELRNPLAPIRTAVELIRLRGPADPVVERARDTIERQSLHLSRLVDDLLDVSRITLGRIHLRHETVDVGEVAAAAVESVADSARRAGLVLTQNIMRPAPHVRGDVTRLMQCVVNLLNNAIKFTPSGGRVQVRVAREGATAVIEVRDTGVGITADNLQRIFDLFVQERHSGHHGNTGLGIGLALTRRLVELHGGTIVARSDGLGHGSCLRIELPAVKGPLPTETPAPSAEPAAAPATGARLLVVDDNRDAATSLGELLTLSGYDVALAHDGEAALQAVAEQQPAAVLLDIGLPDIDGYEICRRIRADTRLARQPLLIAVTGWGQASDQDAARAAGFDAHMTKPVSIDKLLKVLAERIDTA